MKKEMLYKDLARYYDLVYHWKDYGKESARIKKLIEKYKESDGNKLLDIACGTGQHLRYFKKYFHCTGIDINKEMLKIARKKVKKVIFKKADMKNFYLKKKFDCITCLFSAVGYLQTYDNLKKALMNFSKHLKSGGVLVLEPAFTRKNFKPGMAHLKTYEGKTIKIARINDSKLVKNCSAFDFHYLISDKNKIRYLKETHILGLFEVDKTLKLMEESGFKPKYIKNGLTDDRGVYFCVKK
ncbi:methyltransferase domain-containing protein [Candidatus Woesearchaeota archaeon]|nr:methyltransferase domain-containing protein [Candidatus Woesearchaeota archaeon]